MSRNAVDHDRQVFSENQRPSIELEVRGNIASVLCDPFQRPFYSHAEAQSAKSLADVPAGTEGTVTLKVIVLEGARKSNSGPGKVVNGGDTTTVKVGNDAEYSVETV